MGTIRFDIPYPPTKKGKSAFCRRFGLNAYYSGKHWAQRKKDADELHALTLAALKQARVRRGMVRGPVSITFAWDDGLDIDNHAAIAKAVVDALKGYLLPDDDHRWYRQVIHMFDSLPTIDAVPVVRCRDCEWFNHYTMECESDDVATDHEGGASFSINFGPDDFCSYGQRKEADHG